MAKEGPAIEPLSGTSDASGNLTLKTRPGEPGQTFVLLQVAVRNSDTDNVLAQVGIERAARQMPLETVGMWVKGRVYSYKHLVAMPSESRIVVQFSGAGNLKLCEAWVFGYYTQPAAA